MFALCLKSVTSFASYNNGEKYTKTSKKPKTLSFPSSQSLNFKITSSTHLPLCASVFPYIVVSPLHTCKYTIGFCLGQPLMLSCLSSFRAIICTFDTSLACVGACTRDKMDRPLYPLLTCDCHAPKAFSLRYVFVLLWIVLCTIPCLLAQMGPIWLTH